MKSIARAAGGAAAATFAGLSFGAVARAAHAAGVGERVAQTVAHVGPARLASSAIDWSTMDAAHAWARLVESLQGTGPMFAELGLMATTVIAIGASGRAFVLWRRSHSEQAISTTAVAAAVAASVPVAVSSLALGVPPRIQVTPEVTEAATHSDAPRRRFTARLVPRLPRLTMPRLTMPRLSMPRVTLPSMTFRRAARRTYSAGATGPAVLALAGSGATRVDIARRTGLSRDAVALALYIDGRVGA